jgi:hypothetical protein
MRVLLIHGMARTPLSLLGLAGDLRRAGHHTELVAYSGTLESYRAIVARVRRRLEAAAHDGQPYAAVAHSLVGARRFHRWWLYRLVNGECGQLLAEPGFFADLPQPAVPTTVITGNRGWPRALSLFGGDPNDGMVAVEETRLDSGAALIELPASHTFMMNNRQVRAAVREVLFRAAA